MKTKYFDSNGNEIDERMAFDNRGMLRNGFTMRVPLTVRDSNTSRHARITDGTDNPFGLSRPGFRFRTGDTRQSVADAYKDYEHALVNAYRCDDEERDGLEDFGNASTHRENPASYRANGRMMQDHQARMNKLYADRDSELANMWRTT